MIEYAAADMLLGRQRRGIDVLVVVSVISLSVRVCYGFCSKDINPSLTNWAAPGHDAAFICCGGTWDSHDIEWQKGVAVKGTRWCGQWEKLGSLIEENAVYGVQTLALMYRHWGCPQYCIDTVPKHYLFWYASRWLVFGHFHTCPPIATFFTTNNSSLNGCVVSARFKESGMTFTFVRANRSDGLEDQVTDQYLRYDRGHRKLRSLRAFSGRKILMACIIIPSLSLHFTTCTRDRIRIIQDAMTIVNATLVKIILSYHDPHFLYLHENVDILMAYYIADMSLLTNYDVPFASDIVATTFYVRKSSTHPVTIGYILEGSKLALYLLVVCLLLCFAVLVVTDLLDVTTSGITVASDTALFFVATFFATSCDLPATVLRFATRRCLILVWVAGIFAFLVCFKAQLTSWLISEIPEGTVDDLMKLKAALDGNTILPCVTRGAPEHAEIDTSGTTGILGKLKSSLGPQTRETVKEMLPDCLKCASEKARICIALRQPPCIMKTFHKELAESKDPLWFQYSGVPVRKHYPLKMAFRFLAERVFEADWRHRAFLLDCKVSGEREIIPPTPVSLNLSAVAQILLPCFGVSLAVFILELLLGRYFILRSRRFTRVRVV